MILLVGHQTCKNVASDFYKSILKSLWRVVVVVAAAAAAAARITDITYITLTLKLVVKKGIRVTKISVKFVAISKGFLGSLKDSA